MKQTYDWDAIQTDITNGLCYKELQEKHGVSRYAVARKIQRGELTRPHNRMKQNLKNKVSKHNWTLIQELYDSGHSLTDISQMVDISKSMLLYASKRGWLSTRSTAEAMRTMKQHHPEKMVRMHTDEGLERLRQCISERYKTGWMPGGGRCKKMQYVSPVAGAVSLDGTWEYRVARWLDSVSVSWIRNTQRFEYRDDQGKLRFYTPDFYVPDLSLYIEVKGYETQLDRLKWQQFPGTLLVWRKKEVFELKEGKLNMEFNIAC